MIKKCPKCGADNGPESSACYNCFTSLEDVEASVAPAAEQAPPASAEPQAPSDPGIGQPAPPAQPQSPYAPPPAAPMGANSGAGYGQRPGGPLTSPEASGEPASAVGQPLGSYQGQQQQPPGAYGPPPSPYGPPPGRPGYVRRGDYPRPEPVKSSSPGTIIALVVVLLLIVGGFAYWKFVYEPKTPMGVVRNYIKAAVAGDLATAKKSLCRSSQSRL